ncbi:MAG TPA: SDR family NAD(P)-dependent oxidoreductase [Ktedonobacterales bacterium]|jgi:3-oxoacyl-[acyl-carrier protein] reductase|nr:SDR family NAD(P)-dependent oxidoreductase [Ktedonobacterales bacterium]
MGRLDGRVALVTGAGRGIGAATALRLAEEGARVALVDLDEAGTAETAKQVTDKGSEGLPLVCDVADSAAVQAAVDRTASHFGRLDILVNNAGVVRDNLLFKMSDADFDTVIAVHLRGAFLCARAAQKYMVEQKYGRIISLSSTSALGNRGQVNYSAAKAALQGLTRTLAIELGPLGITVNAVAPGFIDTAMTQETARRMGVDPEVFKAAGAQRIPLRRVGQPSEVASVIAFLASDDASFVSGQIIYVAGGPAGILM